MTRVDFYILEGSTSVEDFACRLTDKVYGLGQTAALWLPGPGEAESLDRRLWTFRQESFIPHALAEQASGDDPEPIILCTDQPVPAAILINLTGHMAPEPSAFTRIAEVIPDDEDARREARDRYRRYREAGCELKAHTISK